MKVFLILEFGVDCLLVLQKIKVVLTKGVKDRTKIENGMGNRYCFFTYDDSNSTLIL